MDRKTAWPVREFFHKLVGAGHRTYTFVVHDPISGTRVVRVWCARPGDILCCRVALGISAGGIAVKRVDISVLLADTEAGKNLSQQGVAADSAGYFTEVMLALAQVLCQQFPCPGFK